jgi:uncharacterized protein YndB with AHSA1/START domain
VAVARRTRVLRTPAERVWELIEDPHHMPRWWPGVTRMEGVEEDRFTQVFTTKRGKPVRMDLRVLESDPPHAGGAGRRVWEQELPGTPFERVLGEAVTEVVVEPVALADGVGTRVTIAQRQKLRGYSRTGGLLLRRATGKKLNEALEGLERICG